MSVRRSEIILDAYHNYGLMQLPSEIEMFAKFFEGLQAKNIMEIGSCFGGMFYVMCKLSEINGIKISLDYPFYDNQISDERYLRFMKKANTFSNNVHIITGDSHDRNTLEKVENILCGEELDFLFIDGDHSYEGVKQDFEMYKHLIKNGGYIGFHDINDTQHHRNLNCHVSRFWDEIDKTNAITFNVYSFAMGIGVIQIFKHSQKLDLNILYEAPDKFHIQNNSYYNLNLRLSIKESNTKIPLYFCDINFDNPGVGWYVIPLPRVDYRNHPYLNSLLFDFYDLKENLIDSKKIKIKDDLYGFDKVYKGNFSPFGCLWINYQQMFLDKIYEQYDLSDLDVVIDAGANVGLFTAYISTKNPKIIHAIEPTSVAFYELQKQFNYCNGVRTHKIGLGGKNDEMIININNNNHVTSSFLIETSESTTKEHVDVLTLPKFYETQKIQKIDLVKLDIEGMEYEVIDVMKDDEIQMSERYLIEYHMNEDNRLDKILDRFRRLGYEIIIKPDNINENVQGHFFAKKKDKIDIQIIEKKTFPKRAFITFTNEYYLPITEKLVKSILLNSNYPILVYSINCDANFCYPNMYSKRIDLDEVKTPFFIKDKEYVTRKYGDYNVIVNQPKDTLGVVDRNNVHTYFTLSRKPFIILDAINNGLEEGIFLDADVIAKENIDSAFNYLKDADEYPLIGRGLFEYMILNGKGYIVGDELERPLMNLLGVNDRTMHYVATNFIVFSLKTKKFIEDWVKISNNEEVIKDNVKYAPYHDETIANVLLWKYGATKHLPVSHFNLINSDKAIEFYHTDKRNTFMDSEWQYIPDNIDDIKIFHGCKSLTEIDKTIEIIEKNKDKNFNYSFNRLQFSENAKIAIVTLYDDYYKDIGEISIPNKIKYAKKWGYDLIYFDQIIDNNRPAQWSKIKAIEYALKKYEWVWWIDIDALIMNFDNKLEDIIDENYDIIFTENKYSLISNGSSFFKNTDVTKKFLKECYELNLDILKDIDVMTFDHEQKPMRKLYQEVKEYRDRIKLIHERVCNSYYKTTNESVLGNYPNWNKEDNLYKYGDFVVNFCGRDKEERIINMKNISN